MHSVCSLFTSSIDKRNWLLTAISHSELAPYARSAAAVRALGSPQLWLLLGESQDAAVCLQTSTAALPACLREEPHSGLRFSPVMVTGCVMMDVCPWGAAPLSNAVG